MVLLKGGLYCQACVVVGLILCGASTALARKPSTDGLAGIGSLRNEQNPFGFTQKQIEYMRNIGGLWGAARDGDAKELKKLLYEGQDVNSQDEYGQTPLHYAVIGQDIFKYTATEPDSFVHGRKHEPARPFGGYEREQRPVASVA